MKLTKGHRILKSRQYNWWNKSSDFNTDNKNNVNSFEKDLMINSIFGKTIQNLRKRINFRLVNNAKDYTKCVSKPSFVSHKIS